MITEQISEDLDDFPRLTALVKAYKDITKKHVFESDSYEDVVQIDWCVVLIIPPPDGRYSPASIGCGEAHLKELIHALTSAIRKAVLLRSKDLSARYSNVYKCDSFYDVPKVELISDSGTESIRIHIPNDTQELSVGLTTDEAVKAVEVLNYALSRGPELLDELKDIQ